jgi:hypothetical protein
MTEELLELRREIDNVVAFLEECVVEDASGRIATHGLYGAYRRWAEIAGIKPRDVHDHRVFGRRLKAALPNVSRQRQTGVPADERSREYRGVRLSNNAALPHRDWRFIEGDKRLLVLQLEEVAVNAATRKLPEAINESVTRAVKKTFSEAVRAALPEPAPSVSSRLPRPTLAPAVDERVPGVAEAAEEGVPDPELETLVERLRELEDED